MTALVSILLATYNGERFLAPQIESILAQSHENFELLAIDDGSSDATPAILAEYAARDRRVRLLPSAGNEGQKQRLTEVLSAARGAYISVADQDDVWDEQRTERLLAGIGEAALAFGCSRLIDDQGRPLGCSLLESLGCTAASDDRLIGLFQPRVSGHAMLARREIVTEAAFRRPHAYDWLIGLDAAFSSGWRYVEDAVVNHRIHGANQSNAAVFRRARSYRALSLPKRLVLRSLRLSPRRRALRRMHLRRKFITRLEHLSFSPAVAREVRRDCLRLWQECTGIWFLESGFSPVQRRRLRSLLVEVLRPYAASPTDWANSKREIDLIA